MRANWNLTVTAALLEGSVAETLDRYVAGNGVELVVMTTHGRGGLSRVWLGSVADKLVRRLTVPVLLMRPSEDTKKPVTDIVFRRILIPLDGSAKAEAALEPALALGTVGDAQYLLLRVVEPRLPDYLPVRDLREIKEDSLLGRDLEARRYLRRVMDRLWAKDAKVRTKVYVAGSPALEVLRQADAAGADLIAMATRGAGGVERLLLGSVADKVLSGADIPLLIIRPQDAERQEPRVEQEHALAALGPTMP
jgi:nucleotide-binding universal stress UspA family protein